jgi:hypothetical protein
MLILLGVLVTGCATAQHSQPDKMASAPRYSDAVASALVFDPPISEGIEHPELARGPRAPAAFFGYQDSTSEVYVSATDDLQSDQWNNTYTKESVSVKSGVRYR